MLLAAGAEGRNGGSPSSTMEKGEQISKKPRLEPLPNGHVKQEVVEHEATGGGGAVVAAERGTRVEVTVRMDMTVLHCPLCLRPFKPPVFQCKGGHLACGSCVAELPGQQCGRCENGGGFSSNEAMDAFVSAVRIECSHDGCRSYITYHDADAHQNACPHAPCACTEPGCGLVVPPPALLGHLTTLHSMPVRKIQYSKAFQLQAPVSVPRRLLVGEGDDRAFLLAVGALGAATAVSVVCFRASASPRPLYWLKVWAHGPPAANGKVDTVLAEMDVTSSTVPGAVVAVEELSYLTVPPRFLVGVGASKEVHLTIRIDKLSS